MAKESDGYKDFERIEDERFAFISKDCPWKLERCPNKHKYPCVKEDCAVWYIFKKLVG